MPTLTNDYMEPQQLRGMTDVLQALQRLEHDLPKAGLDDVRNFNYTYLIITRNVRQAARKDSFEHRDFLNRFDARFAHYYFDALRRYTEGRTTPEAWRIAFEAADNGCSSFVSMALGVNAHVNNDIPQVLADCEAGSHHRGDYRYVNRIIGQSIYEAIDNLAPAQELLGPQRRIWRPPYKFMMKRVVVIWRALAWYRYSQLVRGRMTQSQLETHAARIGRAIRRLPV